ncbi:MAG: hypothetical protein WBX14_15450 [Candidatus Udaeobacter sp.]
MPNRSGSYRTGTLKYAAKLEEGISAGMLGTERMLIAVTGAALGTIAPAFKAMRDEVAQALSLNDRYIRWRR